MASKIVTHKRKHNKYTVEFTKCQAEAVRKEAKELGESPAEVLRGLVDEHLVDKYFPQESLTEAQLRQLDSGRRI